MKADNCYLIDLSAEGADLPYEWIFSRLRDVWVSRGTDASPRKSTHLASKFGVPPQRISQWATGTDKTRGHPPWAIITALAAEVNFEIRIADDGVRLVRRRRLEPK